MGIKRVMLMVIPENSPTTGWLGLLPDFTGGLTIASTFSFGCWIRAGIRNEGMFNLIGKGFL